MKVKSELNNVPSRKTSKDLSVNVLRGGIKEIRKNYLLFIMLIPAIVYFIIFHYLPMAGVVLAFKNYNYVGGIFGSPWVGFNNFRFLFVSGTVWKITSNTILYNIAFITVSVFLQVTIAILISEVTQKWFRKLSQTFLFLPYFVSYVLLGAFVYNLFNYEHGTFNTIMGNFGLPKIDMYSTPGAWKYILMFFYQWKSIGYGTVIYLATITGISAEYYEAARIDGSNKWQEIRHITIPLLKPTIIIIVLFAIGHIMRGQFELFYQIVGDNGQLYEATDIIDTYVFRMLTKTFDIGIGAAVGLYQSTFGLVVILLVNWIVKKTHEDYALF
jgi:putative aldouronate transport system permease protein